VVYKGNACILSIHTVTCYTIVRKSLLAFIPILMSIWKRILLVSSTYKDTMLGKVDRFSFKLTWWIGFTSSQSHHAYCDKNSQRIAHI